MGEHRVFSTSFGSIYPLYVTKAEKKGRTRAEVDAVIRWHTGFSQEQLDAAVEDGTDFRAFFAAAPQLNPARALVTGKVCGVDVQAVEDPLMREIRILDKLVDELARGRPMAKILRTEPAG